jgi:hypothetical protein
MSFRSVCLAFVVGIALLTVGCGDTLDQDTLSSTLSNGHKLYLLAYYAEPSGEVAVSANADVASGTPGTLEVSGPVSWVCTGEFIAHPPVGDPDAPWKDLPWFTLYAGGSYDPAVGFWDVGGTYTVRLTLTAPSGSISTSVSGGTFVQASFIAGAGGSSSPDCAESPNP